MGNRSGLAVQKLPTFDLKACLLTCLAVDTSCSLGPCLDLPARIPRCGLFMVLSFLQHKAMFQGQVFRQKEPGESSIFFIT